MLINTKTEDLTTKQHNALINCLEPLLSALSWAGERHHLFNALPYYTSTLNIDDFLHTMKVLNYQHQSFDINLNYLHSAFIPCLFITDDNQILLVLEKNSDTITLFNGLTTETQTIKNSDVRGTVYFFKKSGVDNTETATRTTWFSQLMHEHTGLLGQLLFISFILNLLALSVPLFSMAIYNQVIPTQSSHILVSFVSGIVIALIGSALLQRIQAKIYAYLGIRINNAIGNSVFERLLFLPAQYTESASVSAQVSRIRDFDNIRDFFTGPLLNLIFELPFVTIFIMTIAILGGSLAFIPIVMIGIYAIIFTLLRPAVSQAIERAARNASLRQELTLEALQYIRTIKYTGAVSIWCDRYRTLSGNTALANFRTSLLNTLINVIADSLMMLSAVAVVGLGAIKIMSGTMSIGALIATMMLIWRVLSPLKSLFANQTRLSQIRASIRQVNALMNIETERDPTITTNPLKKFQGQIRFNRVSVRYPNALDPALMNVSFAVNAGEVVAITGRNGSGKSTLFKLLLGLYKPQAGSLYIDDLDIRQMDPFELRNAIGYLPQKPYIFYGSVAQNLYMANLNATEEELFLAAQRADIHEEILTLANGYETLLDDQSVVQLPASFLQRLSLARTYLKNPSIILLDEPANTLDEKGEQALLKTIEYFRKNATVLIITHRPSHLRLADRILLLHEGQLLVAGQTQQVLKNLPKEFIQ